VSPIADHVTVDFELRGCPINKTQLLEVLNAFLNQRPPRINGDSVCVECKAVGNPCIMVTQQLPCLGPVTHAGCEALCPSYQRSCFGCYGPKTTVNTQALSEQFRQQGVSAQRIEHLFKSYNAGNILFRQAAESARIEDEPEPT
jgi:coenzyme F420-reducing hydrogenase gamma subunit